MAVMKDATASLDEFFRRSLKHYVDELKGRDDYEARMVEVDCITCDGTANRVEYRFIGEGGWKLVDTKIKSECKSCTDSRIIGRKIEDDKTDLKGRLMARHENEYWFIPDDLKDAGFKNFKIGGGNDVIGAKRVAIDYVKSFIGIDPGERSNLIFMGNPGTGKTHLSTAIARTLKEQGFHVGFLTTGMLLTKIKSTYNKGSSQTEEDIFKDLRKFELLVLDDLGSESKSKDEFDWSKNKLFEIVNLRIGKPTIYTSNFNEKHLPIAVGERVFSRLYNNTRFIELVTDDYRKNYQIV